MGYINPVITIRFDDLSEDPVNDPIWVCIKNPKVTAAGDMSPKGVALDADGKPVVDSQTVMGSMFEIIASMVLGWRVYDATQIALDVNGVVQPQQLLPTPATPDLVRKLPQGIVTAIASRISETVDPTPAATS